LPGCPPPADRIIALMSQVLEGKTTKLEGANLKFGLMVGRVTPCAPPAGRGLPALPEKNIVYVKTHCH